MSEAKTGMTVATMARILAMYAKDNPDAVVRFSSSESGGYWPKERCAMGAFTDHQIAVHDDTRCGGGVTLGISLLRFEG